MFAVLLRFARKTAMEMWASKRKFVVFCAPSTIYSVVSFNFSDNLLVFHVQFYIFDEIYHDMLDEMW